MEIVNIVPQQVQVTFSVTAEELVIILDAMEHCVLNTSDTTIIKTFKTFHSMLAAAEEPIRVLRGTAAKE